MSEIKVEITNLKDIMDAFGKAPALMTKNLDTAIRQTIFFLRAGAVTNAPVVTGRLRASVYNDFSPLRGELGFNAKYAGWVHDGTSPYIITPKNGKALFWKGAQHPVKVVHHPGIRANPFLQKAVDSAQGQIDNFFGDAVQNTLDQIAKETN